ncbi:Protein 21.1 [Giardia lamblia P15]|uniref:Protein 21.1 n=1 Tax=Giardia intestinalis (strain P15) TaxID=658858 RepID=E1F8V2_GIAIA|nr:Protein 21.1 [Giardia lamblia P15]
MTLYLPPAYDAVKYLNNDIYGINYLVRDRNLDLLATCRIVSKADVGQGRYALIQELAKQAHRLDHESIAPLLEAFVDDEQACTFLISRGVGQSLYEYNEELCFLQVNLEEEAIMTILIELINAILYVYSMNRKTNFTAALASNLPSTGLDPLCIRLNNKGRALVDYSAFAIKLAVQRHSAFTTAYLCPEALRSQHSGEDRSHSNLSPLKMLAYNVGRLCCELCFTGSRCKAVKGEYDTAYMLKSIIEENIYSRDLVCILSWLTNPCSNLRPYLDEVLTHPFIFEFTVKLGSRENERVFRNALGSTQLILSANMNNVEYVRALVNKQKRLTNYDGATALMAAAILGNIEVLKILIPYEFGMRMITGDSLNGATALILAARNGQAEACKLLAPHEAKLKKRDGFTALMEATVRGHSSAADALMKYEAKLVIQLDDPSNPKNGTTALMLACEFHQLHIANQLIQYEAGMRDSSGYTALHRAAALGLVSAVQLLITTKECGLRDPKGQTALMFAAQYGRSKCVELLCKEKEAGLVTDKGWSALLSAIANEHTETAKLLIDCEGHLALNIGYTPLMCAVEHKQYEVIDLLKHNLARKVIMTENEENSWHNGATALMLAAYSNDVDSCRKLVELEEGIRNADGMTASMIAASNDSAAALSILCMSQRESESKLIGGSADNRTCLMIATLSGSLSCVRVLVERGIGVGCQDSMGSTALIMAALSGYADICRVLAPIEARVQRKDGFTALMSAAQEGHRECVSILLSKEGDIHKPGGWTALMSAALKNKSEIVQILSKDKRQIKQKREKDGITALMIAVQSGHTECIRILAPLERNLTDKKGRKCEAYARTEAVRRILAKLR